MREAVADESLYRSPADRRTMSPPPYPYPEANSSLMSVLRPLPTWLFASSTDG